MQTRLNTGHNMRKVLEQSQGTSGVHAHKKKPDEFYVRLKPATVGRLLAPLVQAEESVFNLGREDATSVVSSVRPEAIDASSSQGNILILDLRPFETFEHCHVFGAQHYDTAQLNRASNNFPKEVYFYKVGRSARRRSPPAHRTALASTPTAPLRATTDKGAAAALPTVPAHG